MMAIIKKIGTNKHLKDVEKLELSYNAERNVRWCSYKLKRNPRELKLAPTHTCT